MRNSRLLWTLAIVITLASAVWQRLSGPTYPLRGRVELAGEVVKYRLTRTHGGPGDQPVRIVVPDTAVGGEVAWRRFPSSEGWQRIVMSREGEALVAALPHQPPAGKLEYQVRLAKADATVAFPERAAVTRFKGDVSTWILGPHILAMFLGMLFSTRAGLAAVAGLDARQAAWWAFVLFVVGGLVLGPAVQKQAFGEWWTGVPWGWDLTDNKTLVVAIAWAVAVVAMRGRRPARGTVAIAALLTLVVFAIPHSVWGSEIKWDAPMR
jgi:hypothetical protein